jgi:DNA-directed RNA polymerase I, II, and III subunit RPABC2
VKEMSDDEFEDYDAAGDDRDPDDEEIDKLPLDQDDEDLEAEDQKQEEKEDSDQIAFERKEEGEDEEEEESNYIESFVNLASETSADTKKAAKDILSELTKTKSAQKKWLPARTKNTSPFMTRYEKPGLIGFRTKQLQKNSPPMLSLAELGTETNPFNIAEMELEKRVIPVKVRRYRPDGYFEDWAIGEFEYIPE